MSSQLSIFSEQPSIENIDPVNFHWPIVTQEDENAVLEVLRKGSMSGSDVTKQLETEYAAWQGNEYALGCCNGTAALLVAMHGCGVGAGDEIICPSLTYWASATQALALRATPVFADVLPDSLCIDPNDIEHRITPRTKAIMVVHYTGRPCDMDEILAIAKKHNLKVIEDISHAQGTLYKGKKTGTFGDASGISLMAGKSLASGEGGMFTTDSLEIYERAVSYGHYERYNDSIQSPELRPYMGIPRGGMKNRMNQLSSAFARGQLKHYDARCNEINDAMNHFCDLIEAHPALNAKRPSKDSGHTLGGWYAPFAHYDASQVGGLSITRFCQAVSAEGAGTSPGMNLPLHTHPLFYECDVYNEGQPTAFAHNPDAKREPDYLPVSETCSAKVYSIPWFKKFDKAVIQKYADAFLKVAENHEQLLKDDPGNPETIGSWGLSRDLDKKKKVS